MRFLDISVLLIIFLIGIVGINYSEAEEFVSFEPPIPTPNKGHEFKIAITSLIGEENITSDFVYHVEIRKDNEKISNNLYAAKNGIFKIGLISTKLECSESEPILCSEYRFRETFHEGRVILGDSFIISRYFDDPGEFELILEIYPDLPIEKMGFPIIIEPLVKESFVFNTINGTKKIPSNSEILNKLCKENSNGSENYNLISKICGDYHYGEYFSQGNEWIELTYSEQNPPIWSIWKGIKLKQFEPQQWRTVSSNLKEVQQFYNQLGITVFDVIESNKNSKLCKEENCVLGTFHLLVPEKDQEKFQSNDFRTEVFQLIPPKKQQYIPVLNGEIICKEELKLIFKNDNDAACVKLTSIQKLIERGWAKKQIIQIPSICTKSYFEIIESKFDSGMLDQIDALLNANITKPYSVILIVADHHKQTVERILQECHGAESVSSGQHLSFVTAMVPLEEIPKLSTYGEIGRIGRGDVYDLPSVLTKEEGKAWVQMDPVQCQGNPWHGILSKDQTFDVFGKTNVSELDVIRYHYEGKGISVYNIQSAQTYSVVCEGCGCPRGDTIYLLVNSDDTPKMIELGFTISEEQN